MLAGRGLLLVSLDLSKFFDSIEWGLIKGLASELGLPPHILDTLLAFLSGLRRRLKVGDTFSSQWIHTICGTPQGDALSILWANLASVVLSKRLSALRISIGHKIYVDDRYIWVKTILGLNRALAQVSLFDNLAKNRLNPDKTKLLATSPALRKSGALQSFEGHPLKMVRHIKGLGCTISGMNSPFRGDSDKRVCKALASLKRAKSSLTVYKFKKRAITCKVNPQYTYGSALARPSSSKLRSLRTATVRTLWGRGRSKRAPEMVLLALSDPSRADPECAVAVETIASIVRMVHSSPPLSQLLLRLISTRGANKSQAHFPSARLLEAVRTLDASISDTGIISHPLVPSFSIINNNVRGVIPFLRELTQAKLTKSLRTRASKIVNGKPGRSDFKQLPEVIDMKATFHLLNAKPSDDKPFFTECQRKAYLNVLTGAQRSNERLHRHAEPVSPGLPPPQSPACPFCSSGHNEDLEHIIWKCSAHQHATAPFIDQLHCITQTLPHAEKDFNAWPFSLRCHGIISDDPDILAWRKALDVDEFDYPAFPPWACGPTPFIVEGRYAFATDGSTQNPTDPRLRYSGVGCSGPPGSSWAFSSPLRGVVQQNDKAELVALVLLLKAAVANAAHFPYGIIVYIDNKWVCDTAALLTQGTRLNPSISQWKWWTKLDSLLQAAPPLFLKTHWVPSHMTEKDVQMGVLTSQQLTLNALADELADRGASANAPPIQLTRAAEIRIKVAMAIQRVIVAASISRNTLEAGHIEKLALAAPIPLPPPPLISLPLPPVCTK